MNRTFTLTVIMTGMLILASCSQKKPEVSNTADKAAEVQPVELKASGTLNFSLLDDHNQTVRLSDFKGKVVILDFWATWCPPCRSEIPDFIAMQKQHGSAGLQIIGVTVDQKGWEVVTPFMQSQGINYPILMSSESVYNDFQNLLPVDERGGIPFTFIFDRKGNVVNKLVGARPRDFFESAIKPLL
jgi:thiol-disulfide isomerase/thioredoxin